MSEQGFILRSDAIVTISEVFCLMRYGSVQNTEIHLFCSENRNFLTIKIRCNCTQPSPKRAKIALLATTEALALQRSAACRPKGYIRDYSNIRTNEREI